MPNRFLAGFHPALGRMGVWLSRPGIDVLAATLEAHFLLSTDYKNEQVFMTGAIGVAPGAGGVVFFPETIDAPPYVSFNESVDGINYYPFRVDLDQSSQMQAHSTTSQVTFVNNGPYGVVIYYRILCRGIGS